MVYHSHIGVVAFPFGTHAVPLLNLVQRLAASAPGTLFSFFNTAASNKIFNKLTCANVRVYEVWDGTPRDQVFSGSHFEAIGLFLKACPANFETVMGEAEEESGLKMCCLISDAFMWFTCDLAEKRGVPWVALWTSASCSLSAHMYTDDIIKALGSTGVEEKDEHEKIKPMIPGLEMVNLRDLPPEVFLNKNPSPIAVTINKAVEKLPRSSAVILNSFEEIDPVIAEDMKSKFRHFLNIGPTIPSSPIAEDKTGCLTWLEKQNPKSVVYISFGTVATPPENELKALAEALEDSKFPFLWSLRDGGKGSLPGGFVDRTKEYGKIVPWAPQLQVLAHDSVGVFVTHCGWNSIVESIWSGVPMICRPFFGDQKLNSRMVQDSWKIGLRAEGGVLNKSGTMEALNRIMTGDEGKGIRENVNLLKQKAKIAVEPEGSSSKNFEKLLEIISI